MYLTNWSGKQKYSLPLNHLKLFLRLLSDDTLIIYLSILRNVVTSLQFQSRQ